MNKTLKQLRKQAALTIILLAIIAILNFNILLSPKDASTNTTILFEWIGLSNTVLVDDNQEFTSPITLKENAGITLEPGEYYWRTTGFSIKKQFKIDSEVTISIKKGENNSYNVENKGNVGLILETLRNRDWGITGTAILDLDESLNKTITENSTFLASQNE